MTAGHVDSREQGRGAIFDLRSLDPGAGVEVTDSAGDVQRFDVVARRTYDKSGLPPDELFSREGPSRLVLITCGGDFDREAGSVPRQRRHPPAAVLRVRGPAGGGGLK